MKINGITPTFKPIPLVIPRGDQRFIFQMAPVLSMEAFEAKFPPPAPPMVQTPGNPARPDPADEEYLAELSAYRMKCYHWRILTSLQATEGLVFETVDMDKPDTYANYEKELRDAGFSDFHCMLIQNTVMEACGLDGEKIREATEAFLRMRETEQTG